MPKKAKIKLSPHLVLIGLISGLFATFSLMCIPCILAAFPEIPLFFAVLGAIALFIGRNSLLLIIIGTLLIAIGVLAQIYSKKPKVCKK